MQFGTTRNKPRREGFGLLPKDSGSFRGFRQGEDGLTAQPEGPQVYCYPLWLMSQKHREVECWLRLCSWEVTAPRFKLWTRAVVEFAFRKVRKGSEGTTLPGVPVSSWEAASQ